MDASLFLATALIQQQLTQGLTRGFCFWTKETMLNSCIRKQNLSQTDSLLVVNNIYQTSQAITVKVLAGDTWGSGVLIQRRGQIYTVVTNEHVLEAGQRYRIQMLDGKLYPASVDKTVSWRGKDLGLLRFRSSIESYRLATLGDSTSLKVGSEVFAAGFPTEADLTKTRGLVVTQGQVMMLSHRAFVGGYQIGYSNDIRVGMSGGPLLNRKGEVIGLNGIQSFPLWENPFIYEDGSLPHTSMQKQLSQISWAIPIQVLSKKLSESTH